MNVILIAPNRTEFHPVYRAMRAKVGRDRLSWYSGVFHDLNKHLAEGAVHLYQIDRQLRKDEITKVDLTGVDIAIIDQSLNPEVPSMLDFHGAARGTQIADALTRRGIVCIGISRDGACNDVLQDAGCVMALAHDKVEGQLAGNMAEARRMVRDNQAGIEGDLLALTLRQPWAAAVFLGGKDIENRNWPAKVRGTIAIHVGKDQTKGSYAQAARFVREAYRKSGRKLVVPEFGTLPSGAIIGLVDIVDCVEAAESVWWEGPLGFKFANPRVLHTPIPVNGKRRFWRIPKAVVTKIRRQLMENGQPVTF